MTEEKKKRNKEEKKMKNKNDFLQYFENERHRTPMHLEIYYSSVMDWCIKIYKKRMDNAFSDIKIYDEEVVICDIENADLAGGMAEAREQLEKWLLEQRAIEESRVQKYKLLSREYVIGNNIAYEDRFPMQYENDPEAGLAEMFIQSIEPKKTIYRVHMGDIMNNIKINLEEEPANGGQDVCYGANVIIDTGREAFSIGRIANKYTLGAAYDKAEKIQYELIRTITTEIMKQIEERIGCNKEKKKC